MIADGLLRLRRKRALIQSLNTERHVSSSGCPAKGIDGGCLEREDCKSGVDLQRHSAITAEKSKGAAWQCQKDGTDRRIGSDMNNDRLRVACGLSFLRPGGERLHVIAASGGNHASPLHSVSMTDYAAQILEYSNRMNELEAQQTHLRST